MSREFIFIGILFKHHYTICYNKLFNMWLSYIGKWKLFAFVDFLLEGWLSLTFADSILLYLSFERNTLDFNIM